MVFSPSFILRFLYRSKYRLSASAFQYRDRLVITIDLGQSARRQDRHRNAVNEVDILDYHHVSSSDLGVVFMTFSRISSIFSVRGPVSIAFALSKAPDAA